MSEYSPIILNIPQIIAESNDNYAIRALSLIKIQIPKLDFHWDAECLYVNVSKTIFDILNTASQLASVTETDLHAQGNSEFLITYRNSINPLPVIVQYDLYNPVNDFYYSLSHYKTSSTGTLPSSAVLYFDISDENCYMGQDNSLTNLIRFPADGSNQTQYDASCASILVGTPGSAGNYLLGSGDVYVAFNNPNTDFFKDVGSNNGSDFWTAFAVSFYTSDTNTVDGSGISLEIYNNESEDWILDYNQYGGTGDDTTIHVGNFNDQFPSTSNDTNFEFDFALDTEYIVIITVNKTTGKLKYAINGITFSSEISYNLNTGFSNPVDFADFELAGNGRFKQLLVGNSYLSNSELKSLVTFMMNRNGNTNLNHVILEADNYSLSGYNITEQYFPYYPEFQSVADAALSSDASSIIINSPDGVNVGDLLLAVVVNGVKSADANIAGDAPQSMNSVPSGWTVSTNNQTSVASGSPYTSDNINVNVCYRIATSDDISTSYTFGFDAACLSSGQIMRITNPKLTSTLVVGGIEVGQGITNNVLCDGVTTIYNNSLIIYIVTHCGPSNSISAVAPSGILDDATTISNTLPSNYLTENRGIALLTEWQTIATPTATSDITYTLGGSGFGALAFEIIVNPTR